MRNDNTYKKLQEAWGRMEEGVDDKHIFKAIFTAGSPGAGKTTASKKILGGTGFREVNIDKFIEFLAKKQNLDLKKMDKFDPEFFTKADSLVSKNKTNYIDGRLPLIVDGTGRDFNKIVKGKKDLESIGYECGLLFVVTDLETAKSRNAGRERSVDDEYMLKAYKEVMGNMEKFKQEFGETFFLLNNVDGGNIGEIQKKVWRFIERPVSNEIANAWIQQMGGRI